MLSSHPPEAGVNTNQRSLSAQAQFHCRQLIAEKNAILSISAEKTSSYPVSINRLQASRFEAVLKTG